MNNYVLTQEAKEVLWRIYEYGVYKFGELQADKYLFLMHNCFDKIASNPYMFSKVENCKNAERYCVCGVDTIYYNIDDAQIDTITIVGRQNY